MSVEHYENFPVASWLCPPALRRPIVAIYHFARTADDIADEGEMAAAERLALLQAYREELHRVAHGGPCGDRWSAVFEPLRQALDTHHLPVPLLDDLLSAFMRDTAQPHYADAAALLDYCRLSAHPVGRLLMHLYGIADPQRLAQSDAICGALQLINFWQDLSVDLPRGRCYVPIDLARQHGLSLDSLQRPGQERQQQALLQALLRWSGDLMRQGAPLVHAVPGRAGWELRGVVQGGLRILEKIGAMQHLPFSQRPRLTRVDVPLLFWRSLWMRSPA